MAIIAELKARLAEQLEKMREFHSRYSSEWSDERQAEWDRMDAEYRSVEAQLRRAQDLEAREAVLSTSQGREVLASDIGMSAGEVRSYSLVRAIRAAADAAQGNPRAWDAAGLEREASEAVEKRLGRSPRGFFVPTDVIRGGRIRADLSVGTDTAGGYLVSDDLLADSFIEMLSNRLVVREAGATMLQGLSGNVLIPRQTGGATAYWVAESGSPTESAQTFDQVALTPHTVGAYTDFSRRLLLQSSISIEQFVRRDLASTLARAIDLAALHGTGTSNQPTGIASTSGIGSVVGGTNGAAPTWANIVALETEVAADNADIGTLKYVTNARVRGKLKTTEKADGTAQFVWPDSNLLNGYPALVSNQVRSDLTKGTSSGVCSAIFFGNWADLLIGMWGALDILVDPYTGSTSGTIRVVALQDVDIALRHPESFAAMLDALTS